MHAGSSAALDEPDATLVLEPRPLTGVRADRPDLVIPALRARRLPGY
jgi:hypothetical protein